MKREYKIDRCYSRYSFWKYALYERRSFLGLKYWAHIKNGDYVSSLKDYAREHSELPVLFSA